MTLIVDQLEIFDKSNLEVIRIEFAKLQKKLEECQKEQEFVKPDIGKAATVRNCGQYFTNPKLPSIANTFFCSQATAITLES